MSRVRVAGGSPFLFYGTLHCNLCYGAFYVIMKKVYVFRGDNLAKRAVYNGYEEAYMSGLEIKEFLSDA